MSSHLLAASPTCHYLEYVDSPLKRSGKLAKVLDQKLTLIPKRKSTAFSQIKIGDFFTILLNRLSEVVRLLIGGLGSSNR
jgi:hypothetical protein